MEDIPMPVDRRHFKKLLSGAVVLCLGLILGTTAAGLPCQVATADTGPDLTVPEISFSPNNPAVGDIVTVSVTVKNQGTSSCGSSSLAGYVDSAIVSTLPVGPLEAGQETTVVFTWQAGPGTHNIKAVADSSGTVAEVNEANNTRTFTLTAMAPDLDVQSITWTPASPSKGDNIVINVVIKNQGSLRSPLTSLTLYIDGNTRGTQNVYGIDPGGSFTLNYNWIAQSGQHIIEAAVDEASRIVEVDKTNNVKTVTFSPQQPDLTIEDITWSPKNPSRDDVVTFTIAIKNQGIGRADPSLLAYYIDEVYQSLLQVNAVEAGASANITFTWQAQPDEHKIRAALDFAGTIAESDETNNEKTVTFSTLAPDLFVKNVTWTPSDVAVGDTVTFTAVIRNQGSGKALDSRAICYIDGQFQGFLSYPAIEAGHEASQTINWQASGGSHVISIVADDDNKLAESNEENNKLNKSVPVIPADLAITKITWSPEDFSAGDTVTFTVTVTNQGTGRTSSFYVAHYVDDVQLSSGWVNGLDSDASANETCTWKVEAGVHTFRAVADADSSVPENNENNNESSVKFAPTMPDLAVGTVIWRPADPLPGREVTFSINIDNVGTLSAGPSRVAYYVDGQPAGYIDIGWLEAGRSITEEFPWVTSGGQHSFKIVADAGNQITEVDEANNTRVVNLPPPDLTVEDITWSPLGVASGDTVTFTATLKNLGSNRSTSAKVSCYIDDALLASRDLPEIEAGGTLDREFTWKAVAGLHSVRVVADDADSVTESDETNNDKEVNFTTETPDLCFDEVGWLMEDPLNDAEVTFNIVIMNQGSSAAPASRLKYAIDGGASLYRDISGLGAGESAKVSFNARLEAGPHQVSLTIDADNDVAEFDESNNAETLSFTTKVPDLVVKAVNWEPADAAPGDPVTITVKLENRGRDKATDSRLTLSVDGSQIDYADVAELDVGSMVSLDFTWTALPGQHEISVLADAGGRILESDETNNDRTLTVDIISPEPVEPATSLAGPSTGSKGNKGFMGDFWWIALFVAALLGVSAFVIALKSFNKDK
jgi:subtilase family serine protease